MKLVPVAVEDMKIGMMISGHGIVKSASPFVGRSLAKKGKRHVYVVDGKGPKGFLFKTDLHPTGCFYAEGSTVWTLTGKPTLKKKVAKQPQQELKGGLNWVAELFASWGIDYPTKGRVK